MIDKPAQFDEKIKAKQEELRTLHSLRRQAIKVHGLPPEQPAGQPAGKPAETTAQAAA